MYGFDDNKHKVSPTLKMNSNSGKAYILGTPNSSSGSYDNVYFYSSTFIQSGQVHATGFYAESSRELKENIKDTKFDGLKIVNSTNIVDFNYKKDPDKNLKVGFIAEDSDKILLDKEGKTIDIYNCIGILMKAVQQLDSKVNKLLLN